MFNELKFLKKLYAKKRKAGANIKPFLFTHNHKSINFSKKIKPFFYFFVVKQLNEIHI